MRKKVCDLITQDIDMEKYRWVVQLEKGVWIADWEGDPGRTIVKRNRRGFRNKEDAQTALTKAREYRPISKAKIIKIEDK